MNMTEYEDKGPIKPLDDLDLSSLVAKSVIVTGGASGLGKAYVTAFAQAGAYVTIADIDDDAGLRLVEILNGQAQYIKCDVTNWEDQVRVFDAAVENSPCKSCDIVIANAGIVGKDDLYSLQDPTQPPVKPSLKIIEINLIGTIYTTKLAMHYFRKHPMDPARDRCLIIKASIAAYIDNAGSPQYNISKFGARGLMTNLRRTAWSENIRINLVAPWFVRTPILSRKVQDFLDSQGVGFALVEDAVKAMLRIATDKAINGRGIGVVPRSAAPQGYMDLDKDDFKDGDIFKDLQSIALATTRCIVED